MVMVMVIAISLESQISLIGIKNKNLPCVWNLELKLEEKVEINDRTIPNGTC
jgi:hypothetical protein